MKRVWNWFWGPMTIARGTYLIWFLAVMLGWGNSIFQVHRLQRLLESRRETFVQFDSRIHDLSKQCNDTRAYCEGTIASCQQSTKTAVAEDKKSIEANERAAASCHAALLKFKGGL